MYIQRNIGYAASGVIVVIFTLIFMQPALIVTGQGEAVVQSVVLATDICYFGLGLFLVGFITAVYYKVKENIDD